MDTTPTETFDDSHQNNFTSTAEEDVEQLNNPMDYEVLPANDSFDSVNSDENNIVSSLGSGEPQENFIAQSDDSAIEEVYEEDMTKDYDEQVVSEEVSEFGIYNTEESVILNENIAEDEYHQEVNVLAEQEQSDAAYLVNEVVSESAENQLYSDNSNAEVQNNKTDLEVENENYIHSVSEEMLEDENAVEIIEELHHASDEDYPENNEIESNYVEFTEENIVETNEEPTEIDHQSFSHQDDTIVEEQEIESETLEKSDKDFDEYVVQNESSESLITSNVEKSEVHDEIDNFDQTSNKIVDNGNQEDENDYDDAVEIVEEKQSEDDEDDNIAQHESESEDEQDLAAEDEKLSQIDNFNVRDSDDDDAIADQSKTEDKLNQNTANKILDSDSDDEGEKEGDLIADIFGKSDDEDEEFTGFGEDESTASKKKSFSAAVISDSDESDDNKTTDSSQRAPPSRDESSSDEGVADSGKSMVYDFDLMLQKKKEERRGRRRRDGGTFISDADDIINAMLTKMKEAAESDREANKKKQPALSKMKMLPTVIRHLKKQDLKEAFVDMGSIAAIADWLTLLPDRNLPHISIRTELLAVLHDLPPIMPETLKSSGIGRAVMMLFKHPRETRKNKESAGRLINKWSRPIFGLNDNFKSMSRGEREQRDLENMSQSKRRRLSSGKNESEPGSGAPEPGLLRPGERGFVMRARVPKPSNKDYVIRPRWNVPSNDDDSERPISKPSKSRKDERLEKHRRNFAERKKNLKMQRAVGISIEGNKMPLS